MGVRVREKKLGSGVWWVFVSHNGRRTSRRVGTQKAALKAAEQIQAKLTLGHKPLAEKKAPVATVQAYWEHFESTYLVSAVALSTAASYRKNFRAHILSAFGPKRLDQVTDADMETFIADLVDGKKLAKATIETILSQMRRLYSRAIKHKLVSENPASGLSELYQQAPTRNEEIDPLSHEEVPLFLEAVRKYAPRYYAVFLCAIHTGLRAGELAGLQRGDFDWNGKFVTVRRSIDRVHRKVVPTKGKHVRRVDLSDEVLEILRRHLVAVRETWLKKGSNEMPDWIFPNRNGGWSDMSNLRERQFHKCLEKAGLHRRRFHDLRHTYPSLLLTDGAPIAYVSEQMGHKSIELTVKRYGHLVPGKNRHFVNALPGAKLPLDASDSDRIAATR